LEDRQFTELDVPGKFLIKEGIDGRPICILRDSPVRIIALNTSFAMVGRSKESEESLLEFIPGAEACGVPSLRVIDGKGTSDSENVADIAAALDWWRNLRNSVGSTANI
jgi:hypothetical protein